MSDTKKCSKCGVEKPAAPEFFVRDKSRKCGLRSECRECRKLHRKDGNEYYKLYRKNNPEKIKEINKLYRENNKQNNPYGIYKIANKETGKIYIGETIDFTRRVRDHKKRLKSQSHANHLLQETFNSGGQDFDEIFEFEILEEWGVERKQELDSEKGKQCPKYKLLKQELKKREAEVIEEYIQQGHDLYNREYLEAAGE